MTKISALFSALLFFAATASASILPAVQCNPNILPSPFPPLPISCDAPTIGEMTNSTGAPCRDYIDPVTQLVYYYDCNASTLTPDPAAQSNPIGYNAICVESYNSGKCDTYASGALGCKYDWCVFYEAADVGTYGIEIQLHWTPAVGSGCTPQGSVYEPTSGGVPVTYTVGSISGWGPCHGFLSGALLVGGTPMASDGANY